jgi:hypothetical protein
MVLVMGVFIIGEILACIMAWFLLSSLKEGNWRAMLVWSTIPSIFSLIFTMKYLNESPRYLLLKNK